MEGEGGGSSSTMNDKRASGGGQEDEVRKGPWTMEEDLILVNYIANHGEGVWNNLARSAGLNRTGKSCRLRWLNYLRPDVRRGNITPQEQLLIMELHARWGNRWSKIARQLPGRTDNEIKNYWRTRIQKRAKQGEAADLMQTAMLVADEPNSSAGGGSGSCLRDGRAAQTTSTQYPGAEQSFIDFGGAPPQFSIDCADNLWSWDDFWLTQSPDVDDCLK